MNNREGETADLRPDSPQRGVERRMAQGAHSPPGRRKRTHPETRPIECSIFLSHAAVDREAAESLASWLKSIFNAGVFVSSIEAGEQWRAKIFEALEACAVGIVLATPNSAGHFWVHAEIGALLGMGKRVIPLYCGRAEKRDWPELSELQCCDYNDNEGKKTLIDGIKKALTQELRFREMERAVRDAPELKITPELRASPIRRDMVRSRLLEMIECSKVAKEELLVAGIANTEFFAAAADEVNEALRNALKAGMKARFLFLDPACHSADLRHRLERNRMNTPTIIEGCLDTARGVRDDASGAMQIRLAHEMTLFMCANQEKVVYHPYLFSASGAKMPIGVEWAGGQFYKDAKDHFESLWGQRWVLFDLGNVLLSFDHRRVSRKLADCLISDSNTTLERELFNFIFSKSENSPSRNSLLDRGNQELIWLYDELRRQFNVPLAYADFEEIWQSIFDPPTTAVRQCFREVQRSGVKIGICSNTNASHWQKACFLLPELKDPAITRFLSFEQNSVKTDPGFFEKIIERTFRPAPEHLMIDDLDENINAAAAAGLRTLRCTHPLTAPEVMQILGANYFPDLR